MVITKDVKFLKNNYYETTTTNILGNINTSEPLTQSDVIKIDFENNEEIINENETLYEVLQVDQIDSTSPEFENVDNSQQDEPNIEEPVVVSTSNQRKRTHTHAELCRDAHRDKNTCLGNERCARACECEIVIYVLLKSKGERDVRAHCVGTPAARPARSRFRPERSVYRAQRQRSYVPLFVLTRPTQCP
ncbi:hypothetical protein ACJJTC_018824 [Scirpophaga incertulas]